MDDASLDDFLGDPKREEGDDPSDVDDPSDGADSTYGWTPDGAECADCGATVQRRWRDDGRFVCVDCKTW